MSKKRYWYMIVVTKEIKKILAEKEFSAYGSTDAVINHKGVDLYIKLLNVKTS